MRTGLFSGLLVKSISFGLLCSLSSGTAVAMYKCSDNNGNISYSQLPCEQGHQSSRIAERKKPSKTGKVCSQVDQFALKVVRRMRRGVGADRVLAEFGGLDTISKGALGIVNYVYSYRLSDNISPEKIASLTTIKCNGGNFGELIYADIPGAVDPESEEGIRLRMLELGRQQRDIASPNSGFSPESIKPTGEVVNPRTVNKSVKQNSSSQDAVCGRYKRKLKALDDKMRSGYSASESSSLQEQRREYRKRIKEWCN